MQRTLAIGMLFAVSAWAQLDRGQIVGAVTDPSGAVVPGVKITIRNAATGAVYETETNENGQYARPNLPTGPYVVVAEKTGLKRLERSGVQLHPTEVLRVDLLLEVGSASESVQVTASVPRLQSDNPETGTTLDNKQMVDLPFSFSGGRLMENLAHKVAAGVNGNRWQNNSNGLPFFSKDVLLDGASVSSWAPGIFVLTAVSMEAVGEFKMQTSGMSAEYGRSAGGIYNYVMKSGANEIHGTAYGSLRNEALNANLFANNARGVKRPLDRKQNYAFSFGGPVVIPKLYNGKNRTFFYAAYENYRDRNLIFSSPNRSVPVPEFYDGDFSRLLGAATGQTDALGR
ncbi:MAG: carboxypeptidase regulatory-like domain-containing protein, partial [Bryobacterales bacterium]|nr:carboxypeptidase regulatory-like domain-containing protein [Bryobacterales bacterium]